ncbi:hypothetical protein [Sphingobacterium sp. LRF_L2]|uniref:hypothetical protein n=1 Tax=Sphingobacterium sp. LRF_L2 TaxID=3369421 RepID=UPI003F60A0B6
MIIKDVLYNNLKKLLLNLSTDSDNITPYSDSLGNPDKEEELTSLAENIEIQLIKKLEASENGGTLMLIDSSHLDLVKDYKNNFSQYPEARFDEILLLLSLINSLNNLLQEELDFGSNVDNSIYSLIDFDNDKFGTTVFHYTDPDQPNNSFIFFNFSEIEKVEEYLRNPSIAISTDLIIQLISNIGKEDKMLESKYYALISHDTAQNKQKSKAYVALNLVLNGKVYHEPYEYTGTMSQDSRRAISVSNNYHQFKDILTILSEYNSQNDILDKFLRLYHVVENFMFKSPLVTLERKQQGKPFSFRDFQRIHSNISRSEIDSLKKLIQKVFALNQQAGVTFETYAINKLNDLILTQALITEDNFNHLLSYLGLEKKNGDNLKFADIHNGFPKAYTEILYAIRCSIVHNKESEFHLTHDVLFNHDVIGDTTKVLLKEFLITTMEEIIIFLITENENDIVWFSNHSLMLWEN